MSELDFITLVFTIMFYLFLIVIVKTIIDEAISNFWNNHDIIVETQFNYIQKRKDKLGLLGALIFPITLFFALGTLFGNQLYNILTEGKNENRLASWVV